MPPVHDTLHRCTFAPCVIAPEDGSAHCTSVPNFAATIFLMTRVLCMCLMYADLRQPDLRQAPVTRRHCVKVPIWP